MSAPRVPSDHGVVSRDALVEPVGDEDDALYDADDAHLEAAPLGVRTFWIPGVPLCPAHLDLVGTCARVAGHDGRHSWE